MILELGASWLFRRGQGWFWWLGGLVLARPAVSVKAGMLSWVAWLRRAVIWSIWASLARAPARLTFSPSASPSQRRDSASAMRAVRLSRIWTRRGRAAGSGRRSGQRRPAMFVDAGRVVGAAAVADGDLAVLEMTDELGPFFVGRGAVFLTGAQRTAAGDECPVPVDDLFGVDGLVAHGGVDVAVPGDELGDVR